MTTTFTRDENAARELRQKIGRLRTRLEKATEPGDLTPHNRLVVVLKGVLDLLADEL